MRAVCEKYFMVHFSVGKSTSLSWWVRNAAYLTFCQCFFISCLISTSFVGCLHSWRRASKSKFAIISLAVVPLFTQVFVSILALYLFIYLLLPLSRQKDGVYCLSFRRISSRLACFGSIFRISCILYLIFAWIGHCAPSCITFITWPPLKEINHLVLRCLVWIGGRAFGVRA